MSKEAMKLAQEWYDSGNENPDDFADMIKQVTALAEQPAPVAKPRKPWVGLTEDEINKLMTDAARYRKLAAMERELVEPITIWHYLRNPYDLDNARAIGATHCIKENT